MSGSIVVPAQDVRPVLVDALHRLAGTEDGTGAIRLADRLAPLLGYTVDGAYRVIRKALDPARPTIASTLADGLLLAAGAQHVFVQLPHYPTTFRASQEMIQAHIENGHEVADPDALAVTLFHFSRGAIHSLGQVDELPPCRCQACAAPRRRRRQAREAIAA